MVRSCYRLFCRRRRPTDGKCGAIRASARRLNLPLPSREIGGGRFFVNAIRLIRRAPGSAQDSAIAKALGFGECPPDPDRPRCVRQTYNNPAQHRPAKGSCFMASTRPLARALGAFALAALPIAPAVAEEQDAAALIARVNGVEIHQSALALAEDEVGASMPQMAP